MLTKKKRNTNKKPTDMLIKEMVGKYLIFKHEIGSGPKRRTYWIVLPVNKKCEIPSPTEAIKFVNNILKSKIDTLDARYSVMCKEGIGKATKAFFKVKDIHMDEINAIVVFRKKNARHAAKDIESIVIGNKKGK